MSLLIRGQGVLGHPGADAVLVQAGRIVEIGRSEQITADATEEFASGWVLPGLRDAHIHPGGYVAAVTGLVLAGARDMADIRDLVSEQALRLAPGAPVVGSRLDEETLAEGRLPTRKELDEIREKRPILLTRYCGHVAIANTIALTRAGIGIDTPDPPGGSIDRDDAGVPTGVLRETAVGLVSSALEELVAPPSTNEALEGLSGLAGLGITRIHAMVSAGGSIWCGSGNELEALCEIGPDLEIDVDVFVICETPSELEAAAGRVSGAGGRLRWAGWKGFADGSLGGLTAAMRADFTDAPGSRGLLRLDPLRTRVMAETTLAMGGIVAVHAIGDAANSAVLDVFSGLDPAPDSLRIEHASVLDPDLIDRFAELGVTASVQPAFLPSEVGWVARRLGPDRTRWLYPLRSLTAAGVALVGGSDSPVEDPNPWPAIAASIDNPITPEESIDTLRALAMYVEDDLEVGGPDSITVVDRNPISGIDLGGTTVLATFSRGRRIDRTPLAWI
jgi:predicted amidohydrolase YtcJ